MECIGGCQIGNSRAGGQWTEVVSSLFDSPRMAAGYARSRPAVHPRIIDRARKHLQIASRFGGALDVGCGAGLSTAPLRSIAERVFGIDPVETMLKWAPSVVPGAAFAAARAEALPFSRAAVDIVTAAGSLNNADVEQFFREARRVLAPGGHLIVYDFGPGRDFRDSDALRLWYSEFERLYPPPPCTDISPDTLKPEPFGFQANGHEDFEIGLDLAPDFYREYVLTETSVAAALRQGAAEPEIRSWCERTLADVFHGTAREVLFRGFIAYWRSLSPGPA